MEALGGASLATGMQSCTQNCTLHLLDSCEVFTHSSYDNDITVVAKSSELNDMCRFIFINDSIGDMIVITV